MVDRLDTTEEKNLTLIASYHCPACASGAEHYSDLFDHGACTNCGSPLKEFEATLTETGEAKLSRSVVLIYSKEDTEELAKDVTRELNKKDVGVIDVHDIIKGSQTSVLSANLTYIMNTSTATLVIPSKHLEQNPVIETCLSNALTLSVEHQKPLVPIYTSKTVTDNMDIPFGISDRTGVNWDGKSHVHGAMIGKERFADQIHNLTLKNSS